MKKTVLLDIISKLRARPDLMRKAKVFVAVGIVGLLVMSGLLIWAGVSTFKFVASKANEVIESPQNAAHLKDLKSGIQGFSAVQALGCWDKAISLMAVEPWVVRPALENLENLKVSCLQKVSKVCEGPECVQKQQLNATKGETI